MQERTITATEIEDMLHNEYNVYLVEFTVVEIVCFNGFSFSVTGTDLVTGERTLVFGRNIDRIIDEIKATEWVEDLSYGRVCRSCGHILTIISDCESNTGYNPIDEVFCPNQVYHA